MAFTLVELMVVVGIIALLAAIVLPAISQARTAAKVAASKTAINTIETGLAAFLADSRVGGTYPPSYYFSGRSDDMTLTPGPHGPPPGPASVGGASLLVWALAGADLLGTPGFRDVNGTDPGTQGLAPWADDMGNNNAGGLYYLQGPQPSYSRSGPYIDISKVKLPTFDAAARKFKVPTRKGGRLNLDSLVFLDAFEQPILYYKANLGRTAVADFVPSAVCKGIYNAWDNANIAGLLNPPGGLVLQGMDLGAGQDHPLLRVKGRGPQGETQTVMTELITNPTTVAVGAARPHNPDSFILLTPGPDGLYGTGDDIANFPVNK